MLLFYMVQFMAEYLATRFTVHINFIVPENMIQKRKRRARFRSLIKLYSVDFFIIVFSGKPHYMKHSTGSYEQNGKRNNPINRKSNILPGKQGMQPVSLRCNNHFLFPSADAYCSQKLDACAGICPIKAGQRYIQ